MQLSPEQITDALELTAEQTRNALDFGECLANMRAIAAHPVNSDRVEAWVADMMAAAHSLLDAWGDAFHSIHDPDDDVQTWGDAYRVKMIAVSQVEA